MTNAYEIQNITPEFLSIIKLPEENGRRLNYLMVMPLMTTDNDYQYYFKIGFASVCAALKASGRNVFTLNLNYKTKPLELLKHAILSKKIDVVMTSGFSLDFHEVKMILDAAKKIKPDIITVVGGGIITAEPIVAMIALENVDYGVIGEGEITVNSLAYALETKNDAADVDGVICFRGGEWSVRDSWPMVQDLNILPFPDYLGFEHSRLFEKRYKQYNSAWSWADSSYLVYITTSRSCPYNCTYCFHVCGNKYRKLKIETVKKCIDWLTYHYPVECVYFAEELTFSSYSHAKELCDVLKTYNFKWLAWIRSDTASKEMLQLINDSGCYPLFVGIESADNTILKSMQKNSTIEDVEQVLAWAAEVGLQCVGNLIFGDPEETAETFWRSIRWMLSHKPAIDVLGLIRAYPGSKIYKDAREKGIIKDPIQFLKDRCPPVNLTKMTDDEYNAIPVLLRTLCLENRLEEAEVNALPDLSFNLAGRCPCCKNIISFPREPMFNITPRQCPICRQLININTIEYCDLAGIEKNVERLIDGSKVAVWAVNLNNFYWLTKSTPILKSGNVYFVNKDRIKIQDNGKYVKTLLGKEVFTPDIIRQANIEMVIVPNNHMVYKDIMLQCTEEFPQVKRIVHISEML